jgi:hypothetical protein
VHRIGEYLARVARLHDPALVHEHEGVANRSRAKPISCVTTTMVTPSQSGARLTSRTSPTSSGSGAEVGRSAFRGTAGGEGDRSEQSDGGQPRGARPVNLRIGGGGTGLPHVTRGSRCERFSSMTVARGPAHATLFPPAHPLSAPATRRRVPPGDSGSVDEDGVREPASAVSY